MIFDYIKAANFFPKYAQSVKNWKHKLRKVSGNNTPIEFTKEDMKEIKKGINLMCKDL